MGEKSLDSKYTKFREDDNLELLPISKLYMPHISERTSSLYFMEMG